MFVDDQEACLSGACLVIHLPTASKYSVTFLLASQHQMVVEMVWETMTSTIDAGGRVVIPKRLRDRLGLIAGARVEITERHGVVEITPAVTPMKLGDDEPMTIADRDIPALPRRLCVRSSSRLDGDCRD